MKLSVHSLGDTGPALVFQHGLCADASQSAEVFPADTGYRLVTMECRGHGRSDAGDLSELSIETFTGDLASVIEERRLGPVAVGGISMGAAIALRLAVRRPGLVRGLILARPAWVAEPAPANMSAMALVGRLLSEHTRQQARAIFERSAIAAEISRDAPDNLASLRGFFSRDPREVTAALLTRIAADGPGVERAEIGRLAVPALVIGHERDVIHPIAHAEALAALIPGAALCRIAPKCEDLERYRSDFREALRSFLQRLADQASISAR